MVSIDRNSPIAQLPALYNAYPLQGEVHWSFAPGGANADVRDGASLLLDPYYGRIFPSHMVDSTPYGDSSRMHFYVNSKVLEVVDELRVPYRRIPVFAIDDLALLQGVCDELRKANSSHEVLLRGQHTVHKISRDDEEWKSLYGHAVSEPSFLPSFHRADFDEMVIRAIWHNQAAILLNDISVDLGQLLPDENAKRMLGELQDLRRRAAYDMFALGIAQHYGLPSVGLDLTDSVAVAAWFALHRIDTDGTGRAQARLAETATETVFAFRCPKDAVFQYEAVRPDGIPVGRPDRQQAWFAHVGWGVATNQMATYLMCAFRLSPDCSKQIKAELTNALFPNASEDYILQHFLNVKPLAKLEGEVRRALERIYYFDN